jgi:Response regulator with putative antiterminator output domain
MENVLIISRSKNNILSFTETLHAAACSSVSSLHSCGDARRLLLEQDFDLVIIDAPLKDESGESLARHIAVKGLSQVLLIVKSEHFEEISSVTENDGVLVISKPLNTALFWSALKLAASAQVHTKRLQSENSKLTQKIEDIRIIDRAKCILISFLNITEKEAHKYIEKHAMDMRTTRRKIAEGILKTYEE